VQKECEAYLGREEEEGFVWGEWVEVEKRREKNKKKKREEKNSRVAQ
jgi:hypothetical protein